MERTSFIAVFLPFKSLSKKYILLYDVKWSITCTLTASNFRSNAELLILVDFSGNRSNE